MKILNILLFSSIFFVFVMSGCDADSNIFAALDGKKKQSEGDLAPFLLHQNYPNPFNPTTIIEVHVVVEMHITLRVFTEDWNEVAVIIDGVFGGYHNDEYYIGPSIYSFIFNAEHLASGVYYYVLEGGGYTQIRKMRILK